MKKVILIFSLVFFVFCDKKEDIKTEKNTSDSLNTIIKKPEFENIFENHLYIVGPHLDNNGDLELGCDCCSSQFYFYDSIHYVEKSYCLEGDCIMFGEYSIDKNGLTLKYNNKYLSMETNFDADIDSSLTKYFYKEEKNNISIVTWAKHKDIRFYNTSNDEVSERRDSLKSSFIETIQNDKEVLKFLRKNKIQI